MTEYLPVDDIERSWQIALFHVFNWMAFPDNPNRRREMLLDLQANPSFWPHGHVSTDFVLTLREIPSRPQLRRYYDAALEEGELAGMILRVVISLAKTHQRPDLASLEKVRSGFRTFATTKDRKYLRGFSKRTLEEIWRRFSSVSHLWAAWIGRDRQLENFEYFATDSGHESFLFSDDLKLMLLEAEEFAEFGLAYRHLASNKSRMLLNNVRRIAPQFRQAWQKSLLPCPVPLPGRADRGRASVFALDDAFVELIART